MPKITCPRCGTTIDLENRRNIDIGKICQALQKGPKTFTDLLKATGLPRKTLSLRLRSLCDSGAIAKNGDYALNGHSADKIMQETVHAVESFGDWKKFARVFSLILLFAVGTASVVSALIAVAPQAVVVKTPPTAIFAVTSHSPYYVGSTNTITFDASASFGAKNNIVSYLWKFGDGAMAKGKVAVTHTYEKAGSYEVTLIVADSEGLTGTAELSVPVLPTPCQELRVDAPNSIKVGETFTASITINGVTDLGAWQFGMKFNPAVLKLVVSTTEIHDEYGNLIQSQSAFVEGPFLKQGGSTYFVVPQDVATFAKEGIIPFHGCCLFGQGHTTVSGSGIVTHIQFQAIETGESSLALTDVMLLNSDSAIIPVLSISEAQVQVSLP